MNDIDLDEFQKLFIKTKDALKKGDFKGANKIFSPFNPSKDLVKKKSKYKKTSNKNIVKLMLVYAPGVYTNHFIDDDLYEFNELINSENKKVFEDFKLKLLEKNKAYIHTEDRHLFLLEIDGEILLYIFKNRLACSEKSKKTLEEIGNFFQVTRERIRQIEKKLVDSFEKIGINFFDISRNVKLINQREIILRFKNYYPTSFNPKLPLIQNFNNISSMHFSQEEKNIIKKYLFKLINDYCFRRDILNEEEVQFGKQYILYHGFNYSRQAYEMLYHELTEFFNRYGRLPTASKVKNRGSEELLASRLFTIKKMYRDKKLSAKLFDLFSKLPNMSWAHRKDSEDERFRIALKDLKEFSITKKRFPKVSSKDPKEKYLAGFIASKEQGFKNGLSIHRKKEFYAIIKEIDKYFIQNNIIKPKKILRSFEDWIVILKDYLKNSGLNHVSARVIVKDRNNVDAALGTWWLNTIKAKYKKGNLKASHQRILKEMGMNLDL